MSSSLLPNIPQKPTQILKKDDIFVNKNALGSRGESIAYVRLTEGYKFNLYFMGEKAQTIDFLLELCNKETPYFAFLQIKTTAQHEYTNKGYLKVGITTDDLKLLIDKPLPTYFVGVDELEESVYIAPVFNDTIYGYTSSIPNTYKLQFGAKAENKKVMEKLEKDIICFSKVIKTKKQKYKTKLKFKE